MKKYWDKIREEKYDNTFERTTEALIRKHNFKTERKSKMKDFILTHKVKLAFAVFLAFFAAACNYPVTQNEIVGYAFSWTAPSESGKIVSESIKNLNWLKNSSVSAAEKNLNGKNSLEYSTVLQGIDEKAAMIYKTDLEKIKEINSIKILPITQSITRPIYSAALYSFFKVDISSKGKTEDEVKQEIERQLKGNGFENTTVSFDKADGKHRLMIKMPENQDMNGKSMEVRVDGDGKEEVVKLKTMKGFIDKDMTDEQIKQKVIEDSGNILTPGDIKIIREGDKIKVEVNKEE